MADNVTLPGTGIVISSKDIGSGVEAQRAVVVYSTGTNTIQEVDTTHGLPVVIEPATTGGLSTYRSLSLVATGVNIKASAGQVYGWYLYNNATTVRFVKLYNTASAPTAGSGTPTHTIPIPPGAAANVSFPQGIAFGTGIGIIATTGVADADTGAPSANDVIVNIFYA